MLQLSAAALLLGLFLPRVTGIDCNNVPAVYTQDRLDEIRGNCTVIEGELWLGSHWTGNANLSGIEEINGDLFLFSCSTHSYSPSDKPCYSDTDNPINVSAPDLKVVRGSIEKPPGAPVKSLSFPKLQSAVEMMIYDGGNIEEFDVIDLDTIGHLILKGFGKLDTIKSNGIRNLTCDSRLCGIEITESSGLQSVGDLLAVNDPIVDQGTIPSLSVSSMGADLNNSALTIGWPNISSLLVAGANMEIQLGGPNTTEMFFENLLPSPDTVLTRYENVKNITIGEFRIVVYPDRQMQEMNVETLNLPFDMVSKLWIVTGEMDNASVEHFSLPERARNWDGVELIMDMDDTEFRAKDEDGETLWFWPRKIVNVTMKGKINMDIFDLLIEQDSVVDTFVHVTSRNDGLDCDKLNETLSGRVGTLSCASFNSANAQMARLILVLGMSVVTGFLLWI